MSHAFGSRAVESGRGNSRALGMQKMVPIWSRQPAAVAYGHATEIRGFGVWGALSPRRCFGRPASVVPPDPRDTHRVLIPRSRPPQRPANDKRSFQLSSAKRAPTDTTVRKLHHPYECLYRGFCGSAHRVAVLGGSVTTCAGSTRDSAAYLLFRTSQSMFSECNPSPCPKPTASCMAG